MTAHEEAEGERALVELYSRQGLQVRHLGERHCWRCRCSLWTLDLPCMQHSDNFSLKVDKLWMPQDGSAKLSIVVGLAGASATQHRNQRCRCNVAVPRIAPVWAGSPC